MSVITKDLGMVTAYAYAVSKGYEGTEEQFAEDLANGANYAREAAESAAAAAASAALAGTSAGEAASSATSASGSAATATTKAGEASASATAAAGSASTASTKASEASNSAVASLNSATQASAAKTSAEAAKNLAETAQSAAETAQGKAEDAQDAAEAAQTAAEAAQASAESAETSATASANAAEGSATTASTKAGEAASSATAAAGSATTASTKASEASASATAAASSATQAGTAQTAAETAQGKAEDAQEAAETAQTAAEAAQAAAEEVLESIPEDYSEMSEDVSNLKKVTVIHVEDNTAEAVKTFSDGADGLPMGLMVGIEPVQDLHGYDNPWPAGGGKNLFKFMQNGYISSTGDIASPTYINNGVTDFIPISSETNYTISAKQSIKGIIIGWYTSAKEFISRDSYSYTASKTATSPQNAVFCRVSINIDDTTAVSDASCQEYKVQFESGSTATSYAPYSNICPISGWTGAKVTRTGINIWDEEWESGTILPATGEDGTASNSIRSKNYIPVLPLTNYYCYAPSGYTTGRVAYYDENKTYLGNYPIGWDTLYNNHVFTTKANAYFMRFTFVAATYNNDISINYPSTETAYHSGHVATYQITFPSEAGTVYGGNLTVNADGTGTLVVDKGMWTFDGDNESWGEYPSYEGYYITISEMKLGTRQDGISNMLKDAKDSSAGQKNTMWLGVNSKIMFAIGVYETMGATLTEFKQYLSNNNLQVVFPLAKPKTYTLTASQVETLKGMNNLWADTGDIKSVDYSADTKIYVDGKISEGMKLMALLLTANHEDGMKASKAYASGDLLTVGNTLYKATTSIANGATLTEGTNVTETTIAQELAALA